VPKQSLFRYSLVSQYVFIIVDRRRNFHLVSSTKNKFLNRNA